MTDVNLAYDKYHKKYIWVFYIKMELANSPKILAFRNKYFGISNLHSTGPLN
jgi:hypothetical protein